MKKIIFLVSILITGIASAQIGIGTTTPNTDAALDLTSTEKGMLIPRMTQAQRIAIATTPATGLLVYQTDLAAGFYYYNGLAWQPFSSGNNWNIPGNGGTNPGTNQLGTTNGQPFILKANNAEAFRIMANNNVVMGNTTTISKLHIENPATNSLTDGFEDNTIAPFITSGSGGNWTTTNVAGNFNSGIFGAQSGSGVSGIGAVFSESNLEYTATVLSQSIISFAVKTSTEGGCCGDILNFYINGVLQSTWSGLVAWNTVSYIVPTGTHIFTWSYLKGTTINSNDDRVYIDDFTVNTINPALRIEDGNQANGKVLISDANGNGTWTSAPIVADDDWRFNSGSLDTDPIFRTGTARIGSTTAARTITLVPMMLDVFKGLTYGTQLGWGSTEYITDGVSDNFVSHSLIPAVNNSVSLGSSTNRWRVIYATNGVISTSDARDKENIQPLTHGLKELNKLNPVSYKWKEEKYGSTILSDKEKRAKIGFLAQELQTVLPETVQDSEWRPKEGTNLSVYEKKKVETLGVSYSEIIPVVVKATQEHQNTLNEIQKLLDETNTLIKQLEKK